MQGKLNDQGSLKVAIKNYFTCYQFLDTAVGRSASKNLCNTNTQWLLLGELFGKHRE